MCTEKEGHSGGKPTNNNEKPKILGIDLETYSSTDLPKCGIYKYCEAEDFQILLFAYAFDDEEVQIIDMACGEPLPQGVLDALEDPEIIKAAWNAQFERTCLSRYLGYTLSPDSWQCTMVHAASLSLPLSLKEAALALKTGEQKDRAGEALIRKFSIPKVATGTGKLVRVLPEDDPEGWQIFKDYCLQDVRTERDIRKKLERFPMPDAEWDYYHMDQRINDRGVKVDLDLVHQAITCDLALSDVMTKRAYELTGLENPNSVSQLKFWLSERGIEMDTLGKKQVADMIDQIEKNGLDTEAEEMLKLRLQMAKSSVKKYQAAERAACGDDRVRGLFQFNGAARTNRWASKILQLQNLPQNHISTLEEARDLIKMGCFDMVGAIYGNTPDILSQLIRTMLIPKDGCEFIVADFSAIEARVLAWEADEKWRIEAFKNGADIYCASASQMFGVPVEKHGKNAELRQKGKISELACIARDSLILTNHGEIPIQYVSTRDKVWDGYRFVSHDGVVFKGWRKIIHYDGLSATEDHMVYIISQSDPIPFGMAVEKHKPLRKISRQYYSPDVYYGFARVYDILNAGPRHRYTASGCIVHNCGYGGSTGALISMGALSMGLRESELPGLIDDWREANPNIVQYWWDVENAAVTCIKTGENQKVKRIKFSFSANTLWMHLPSGRKLAYINPKLQPNKFGRMAITFLGVGNNNRWSRQETYSGKLVENCVAEGTLVLTDRGLAPIESIKITDMIWDGAEWVHHEGLIKQGMQETVSVNGIHMTPDHKILTNEGWYKSGESQGLNWAAVRKPNGFEPGRKRQIRKSKMEMPLRLRKRNRSHKGIFSSKTLFEKIMRMSVEEQIHRSNRTDDSLSYCSEKSQKYQTGENTMAVPLYLRKGSSCRSIRFDKGKIPHQIMWLYEQKINQRGNDDTWNEPSSCLGRMALHEAEMRGFQTPRIPQLWRSWNYSLSGVEGELRGILAGHGEHLPERNGPGSHRQQSGLQSRKLPMGEQKSKLKEQEDESYYRYSIWKDDGVCSFGANRDWCDNASVPSGSWMADRISVHPTERKEPVYDIRNCGKRHRFTVFDPESGKLRIVSNCTQAIARDILAEAMWRMERANIEIVGSVHDEVIIEAPIGKYKVDDICELMAQNPVWCKDLPLKAAGYLAPHFYFKD